MRKFTLLMLLAMALPALADTTITYQGQLADNGEPFNGTIDMEFQLFSDAVDGSEVGSTIEQAVSVIDGLFQVELDFGAVNYQNGLFLQISVDGNELSPRQQVTAAPLAVRSLEGESLWSENQSNILYQEGRVSIGTSVFPRTFNLSSNVDVDPMQVFSGTQGAMWISANRGTEIGSVSFQDDPPPRGLSVVGESHLRDRVLIGDPGESGGPETQFEVRGESGASFFAGDFLGGNFAATAHNTDDNASNTASLAGPPGSQSAFFFGDPVVLGSNTDFIMRGHAEIRDSGRLSVGDPQFDPGPGGIRAEGIIVAEGDFLAAFGELQMATDSMPGGSNSVCRSTTGSFQVLGFCSSSARFKQDIKELESAGALVDELRAVSFRWEETGEADIGLIAEEVAKVDPRLATYDEDGKVQGVKYRHLTAVLVKALQEQKRQTTIELKIRDVKIDSLQATLDAQRRETTQRLAALEELLMDGPEMASTREWGGRFEHEIDD